MPVRPNQKNEIVIWLWKQRVIPLALALVAISIAVTAILIAPKMKQIQMTSKQLQGMKVFLSGTEEAVKRLTNLDQLLMERRHELNRLQARTLSEEQAASMVQAFTESTELLPVTILDIQPEVEVLAKEHEQTISWKKHGFTQRKLKIRMQCRYQTLGRLLERLEASSLIFHVDHLDISAKKMAAPNLDIWMTIASYVDN